MTRLTWPEIVWRFVTAGLFAVVPVLLVVLAATGGTAWLWAGLGALGLAVTACVLVGGESK